ncbi:MAG: amidohydrolase family protein [Candidatus Bathyarchaeota archaeon]|nr:MAG: amidohydrolase family protein [Candidatus Bathyarchaeota archaeon]
MWCDIILKNGRILDGAGNPWYKADIAIKDGKIAKLGSVESMKATCTLDVNNMIVSPGFIDVHNHSDMSLLVDPQLESLTRQGVTTVVNGQCGSSPAPVNEHTLELQKLGLNDIEIEIDWTRMDGYFTRLETKGISPNSITLVGHGTLRYYVMGRDYKRESTHTELLQMKRLLQKAMEDGALGLSTGLTYAPGYYAHTREIIELAKVVSVFGGSYTTHIREWGSKILGWSGEQGSHVEGVLEAIEIAQQSKVARLEISHLSAQREFVRDDTQFNRVRDILNSAREKGIDVTIDVQPESWDTVRPAYRGSIPPIYLEAGVEKLIERLQNPDTRAQIKKEMETKQPMDLGFEYHAGKLLLLRAGKGDCLTVYPPFNSHLQTQEHEYRTLKEIAELKQKDLYETLFDLIVENNGNVFINRKQMNWTLKMSEYTWPIVMVGTDGGSIIRPGKEATERVRPTAFAAYPILLAWVRECGILTLQDMVRRMTSMPARTLGLQDRGLLKEGFWADIAVFNPNRVRGKTSYSNETEKWAKGVGDARPCYPEGIPYVLVNGQFIIWDSEHIGTLPGKVLRHPF